MVTTITGQPQSLLTVLIVGAKLGGVVLRVLLEKANIPYLSIERASTVKPLGKYNSLYFLLLCTAQQRVIVILTVLCI